MTSRDVRGRVRGLTPCRWFPSRVALGEFAVAQGSGEFAISTTAGEKPISARTLGGWANAIVGDAIAGFQPKRIRSGIETLLAAKGVSREVRGHLQSHGRTGVQARHYDGHDYMAEKQRNDTRWMSSCVRFAGGGQPTLDPLVDPVPIGSGQQGAFGASRTLTSGDAGLVGPGADAALWFKKNQPKNYCNSASP